MDWQQAQSAIDEAKGTLNQADKIVRQMGYLMINRLHHMDADHLRILKRNLQAFDSTRGRWKKTP